MNEALLKVEPGLKKYTNILALLHSVDVSESVDFQKAYNGFYRMRQRSDSIHSTLENCCTLVPLFSLFLLQRFGVVLFILYISLSIKQFSKDEKSETCMVISYQKSSFLLQIFPQLQPLLLLWVQPRQQLNSKRLKKRFYLQEQLAKEMVINK